MFSWLRRMKGNAMPAVSPGASKGLSEMLRDGSRQVALGEYGMWFSTPGDECFSMSSTLDSIDRVYEAMRGIEESVFAEVLHCTRSIERDVRQAPLPDELVVVPVIEAQDVGFLVSASNEKGIRFHFHRSTASALRIELLAKFARYFENRRQAVQKAVQAVANDCCGVG
ncbi:hypothetical protein [Rhizobacter sp. P5_C2]